jgi:tRNA(fMet)-specific endonuclease VapC
MILLDTNTCIYIINAKPAAVLARFQQYRLGDIGLCSVVAAELAFGVAKSGSVRNRQALEMFLAPLSAPRPAEAARPPWGSSKVAKPHLLESILPFDDAALWTYGDLRADLERRSTPIGALDTMIAAHALSQHAMLVTNNTREFAKVPGLQLDNWIAEL